MKNADIKIDNEITIRIESGWDPESSARISVFSTNADGPPIDNEPPHGQKVIEFRLSKNDSLAIHTAIMAMTPGKFG